jgi:hypothetical protein
MTIKRRLIAGIATSLLSLGAGAFVATTPAQAALSYCPNFPNPIKDFCLYRGSDALTPSEGYSGAWPRNTCTALLNFDDNFVWNATGTRWFLFHTTTCNGSHAEIAPNFTGPLPSGYDRGQTHAIMRTSTTSYTSGPALIDRPVAVRPVSGRAATRMGSSGRRYRIFRRP